MKALIGTDKETLSPPDLIHALLKARTDLLWFGGIGTYIKAASQAQGEAGDRANDAVRVNGNDLQARVVGEGANLGATQLGRIEGSLAPGCASTPTRWTIPPASTPPTMKSISRSCFPARPGVANCRKQNATNCWSR